MNNPVFFVSSVTKDLRVLEAEDMPVTYGEDVAEFNRLLLSKGVRVHNQDSLQRMIWDQGAYKHLLKFDNPDIPFMVTSVLTDTPFTVKCNAKLYCYGAGTLVCVVTEEGVKEDESDVNYTDLVAELSEVTKLSVITCDRIARYITKNYILFNK